MRNQTSESTEGKENFYHCGLVFTSAKDGKKKAYIKPNSVSVETFGRALKVLFAWTTVGCHIALRMV